MVVNSVLNADGTLASVGTEQNTNTAGTYFSNYINQESQEYGNYLEQIFQKASDTYHVSKDLLKAMAKAESNFRADATSHCGAMGIMQLMPGTAASLGVTDAYNPEQNIMGGAQYISRLLEKYNGNLSYAVAAYNAGSGNVDKYGGIPPFNETQNYVVKVLRYLEEGVTIPNSSVTGTGTDAASVWSSSQTAGTSGNTLQKIMNQYFDYDDYLEFLQLFTRVIYEKLTGEAVESQQSDNDERDNSDQANLVQSQQVQEQPQEPAKILTMKVKDAKGIVNTYRKEDTVQGDAHQAFEYMTAGGQNRMAVFLNKTV
ncbi:Membrane-bound lytic murein transglycosylase F [Eubacterium plexicaudatum ASF492]|uniref:Transglycosylase SLT domain-containing protein n=1 Tax=Eubacterium plexicaudatum ASF492 TaxID=1235802 RepID=N2AP52_9FIRM|nr:Membrane-bound lytic murein transglycosylase F [Eubacterium plexicaudatum ASF492]